MPVVIDSPTMPVCEVHFPGFLALLGLTAVLARTASRFVPRSFDEGHVSFLFVGGITIAAWFGLWAYLARPQPTLADRRFRSSVGGLHTGGSSASCNSVLRSPANRDVLRLPASMLAAVRSVQFILGGAFARLFGYALGVCRCRWGSSVLRFHSSSSALWQLRANPRFEGTAGKQGLPVPRRLRRRAAPQAKRWAS
jgi:hypothetical protein